MNWQRLITRFDPDWRVLLSHLVLFGFVYPNERDLIPAEVMEDLFQRASAEGPQPRNGSSVCQGTLLSRAQYLVDVERMGYSDARIDDRSSMTLKQLTEWTNAIDREVK